MNHIDFQSAPPEGTVVMLDEQEYELRSIVPHTRRDGSGTSLLTWASACPDCGAEFRVVTGLVAKSLNRRCDEHHRLKPVKGRRGRRVTHRVIYP